MCARVSRTLGMQCCVCVSRGLGMEFRAVFVSTVRSRHHASRMMSSCVGEFGFLSDAQLVNTALSRTQSWLAVVGDPVALCSVGNCGTLWRTFLKHCYKVGGVHPSDLSLEDIWQQSQSLMNLLTVSAVNSGSGQGSTGPVSQAPAGYWSDTVSVSESHELTTYEPPPPTLPPPLYSESVMSAALSDAKSTATLTVASKDTATHAPARRASVTSSEESTSEGEDVSQTVMSDERRANSVRSSQHLSVKAAAAAAELMSFSEWSLDYQLEPDEIIRQLAKVCCMPDTTYCLLLITIIVIIEFL